MGNVDRNAYAVMLNEQQLIISNLIALVDEVIENLAAFRSQNVDDYRDILIEVYEKNEALKNEDS